MEVGGRVVDVRSTFLLPLLSFRHHRRHGLYLRDGVAPLRLPHPAALGEVLCGSGNQGQADCSKEAVSTLPSIFLTPPQPLFPGQADTARIAELFPFAEYFSNAPQPIFKGEDYAADLEAARGCHRHVHGLFERLNEYRAFELVLRARDRSKYLLAKEAKIIAMTCTHAALTRRDLVGVKGERVRVDVESADPSSP